MICLINIVSYLLSRQIQSLEKSFLEEGGRREGRYCRRRI